ncbi:carbon-nitrogen hydrolase family protein [Brevundimonas sp.]
MARLNIALIQTRTPATPQAALDHVAPLIRQAAAGGAQLILTPEATNFLIKDRAARDAVLADTSADVVVQGLRDLARELKIWLLIGSAIVKSGHEGDDRAANRSILIDDTGTVVTTYDKLHVFDVDLPTGERWRESASIRPGDAAVVADTPWGRLGLTICYDVRFPHLHRALAKAGASMIAVPAAFTVPTGEAHWETLLRARAIESGAYILAPAQAGAHEDGRRTWGRSTVVAPWGEVIARLNDDEPGVLFATLDFDAVTRAREAVPQLTHDRDFTLPSA